MSVLANRVATIIPHQWRKVAVQLELSGGEIKAIQNDERDSFHQFMAVMYQWKQFLSIPFTWDTLVTALRSPSVNEIRLSNELNHEFFGYFGAKAVVKTVVQLRIHVINQQVTSYCSPIENNNLVSNFLSVIWDVTIHFVTQCHLNGCKVGEWQV